MRVSCRAYLELLQSSRETVTTTSVDQGFEKPQGFYPRVRRVGVGVQILRPPKNPYPSEGYQGFWRGHLSHQENVKMLSHAYLYLVALFLKIRKISNIFCLFWIKILYD